MGTPEASQSQRIIELETALLTCKSERDAALRELDDLARYLSHDLRAPLRGINSYSKALVEDYGHQLAPAALSYLQYIADAGQQAAATLDQLIHYIRIPQTSLSIEALDLSELAAEIGAQVGKRYAAARQADGREAEPMLQVMDGLLAQADERLARILLTALLDNAWKFSCLQVQAVIRVAACIQAGEMVFLVEDNGAGFNPAFAERLFQPFQRLHSAHEFPGVGLGLAVARRIVERHGGRIWAQGEVGRGASIFFTFNPS